MVVKPVNESGVGLILALILLALLTMLVGSVLTAVTVEVWIGNNYRSETQLVYLAEAGIEDGREALMSDPIPPSTDPFIQGRPLLDTVGRPAGRYTVTMVRNNPPTLRSIGQLGLAQKTVEVRLKKSGFPPVTQAVTLNEDVPLPAGMDPQLQSTAALEQIVERIGRHATDTYRPGLGEVVRLGPVGSPEAYRVVVIDGDAAIENATGYGLLVVRGELELLGMVSWNGLILVIGQGVMHASASSTIGISGAIFLTRTRANDRSPANLLGTLMQQRGPVTLDLPVVTTTIAWNVEQIDLVSQRFPYVPTSWREY